jgi:hypothetical protein
MRVCTVTLLAGVSGLLLANTARSDDLPPPAERAHVYSPYELETIEQVLHASHASLDPAPEGKRVERIDVVPLDVFEPRDPIPTWVNVLHATSRRDVIRRELLLEQGHPYRQLLVDDTIRNLRRLVQLSVVLVVATKGTAPDRVGVIVITKDVWSLRLSWDAVATSGGIEELDLQPTEENLLGTHQLLRAYYTYQPSAQTFGLGSITPRIGTSRVALVSLAEVMVNSSTGSPEGSTGSLVAGQPLYSIVGDWAWTANAGWTDVVTRRYVNAHLSGYTDTATGKTIPYEYRSREYVTGYTLTRSFGCQTKHDVTLGFGIDRQVYRSDAVGADPQTVADFVRTRVPTSDTRVGPSLQYHGYSSRYVRLIDFDTLALQEDFRLGHDVVFRVYPSFRALGATRDVLGLYGAAQATVAVRDGLFRALVDSTVESQPDRISDASIHPAVHFVSPSVAGLGRVVFDAQLLYRFRNFLNQQTLLGGGDQLRGYPTSFFVGEDVMSMNLELRTRPVEFLTCQFALVGFLDSGDAFQGVHSLTPYQSAGVGLRTLFPQLDRTVFRVDVGVPFEHPRDAGGAPIAPYAFVATFGQAFDTPSVDPTPVLPTGQ